MQFFTQQSVILTTLVVMIFGFLWYSVLFNKAWLIGEGFTKKEISKRSKAYMLQINLYSMLAHGALVSVLALMFDILQVSSLKVAVSLGLLFAFGFIVITHFIDMIYTVRGEYSRKENQIKFLVSSGYYLCMVALASFVLFCLV